jgi:hypothetical protein
VPEEGDSEAESLAMVLEPEQLWDMHKEPD